MSALAALWRLNGAPRRRALPYGVAVGYGRARWPLTVGWRTLAALAVLGALALRALR
jgi:hypothetical protein